MKTTERRCVRVGTSTYIVAGMVAVMLLIAGVGLVAEGKTLAGEVCFGVAVCGAVHLCGQRIEVEGGVMTVRRPFRATRRIALAEIMAVKTVWWQSYRRFVFMRDEMVLGAFNPKLFERTDLAFLLNEVRLQAPAAKFDEDTRAFLPGAEVTSR